LDRRYEDLRTAILRGAGKCFCVRRGGVLERGRKAGGTYKTLAEQREVLTPAEEKFERARQTIGLFLGPVGFLIMYFLPLPLPRGCYELWIVRGSL
jgi:hypothetical protein